MRKSSRIILFVAVLLVLVYVVVGEKLFQSFNDSKKEYQYISLFSEVVSLVKTDYVEAVDPAKKFPGAYSAMLSNLHRTAAYLDTKETRLYNLKAQARVCGTGIYGTESAGYFLVTGVVPGSPAETAGIKPGVLIKAVNNKTIFDRSLWCMYLSMLSEEPQTMEMIVLTEGSATPSQINVQTSPDAFSHGLSTDKIRPDILKIAVTRIDKATVNALETILKKDSMAEEPPRLILDLRDYNGGDLDGFLHMTRLLIRKPLKLVIEAKDKQDTLPLGSSQALDSEVVIIIDGSTIMYAELLAAALKKRSAKTTFIGSSTHGFVSKLDHYTLDDGSSVLLPQAFYLIDKKNPAKEGLEPDIKINPKKPGDIFKRSISILTHDSHQKETK